MSYKISIFFIFSSFLHCTLYLKLFCASCTKRKIGQLQKQYWWLSPKATKLHSTISPSNNSGLISGVKSLEYWFDVMKPRFSGQPFKSTLTISNHPTLQLGILETFNLDQRTKGASCRIIPQLQLWASLNSWRNGKGHLMSCRYSYRQPLSTADTGWDHDL